MSAAEAWEAMGRPESELYRGVRLGRAVEWQQRSGAALTVAESEFLDAAVDRADAERREVDERARRHAAANRRLRVLVAVTTAFALIAVAGVVIAARQASRADDAAHGRPR